jgi:hypothetical protein
MEYAFGGDPVGANEEPGGGDACVNGGFENATLSPWGGGGSWGTFSRSTTQQRSGDACLRLQPSSACHQVLAGLVAGSTYRITAYIRCETGGSVRLGVKNHGAEETSVQTTATDYTPVSLDFTPTTGTTSAEVYLYSNSASGGAWVDDVTIPRNARLIGSFSVPTPAYDAGYVVDGGFEMDPSAAWGAAGSWGTSARTTSVSHTGAASLRLESPAASHQIIAGLEPSTTYVLTAYIRSETGGTVYLGVKNHGAAETNVSTTDATFSPVSLTFTTGPSSTGAEVYVWRDNSATGGAWIDTVSLAKDGAVGGGILDPLPAFDIVASGGYEWPAMHFNRMRPDVTYEVLGSDNLIDWPVVSTNAGAVNSRVTFLDAARVDQNPRRFLRMRVSRP